MTMSAGRTMWPGPRRIGPAGNSSAVWPPSIGCSDSRPQSHAAAGWQINGHGLALEREYGLRYASDTRGGPPFLPLLADGVSSCPQLPHHLAHLR